MPRLLIRTVLLSLVALYLKSQYVHENVVFQKVNEVSLTRSEWKIACIYELKAIINYVNLIGKEIGKAHKIISSFEREYHQMGAAAQIVENKSFRLGVRDHSGFTRTFAQMRNEIVEYSATYKKLQEELQSYVFLSSSSRERRSLIPLAGKVLSGLFGLATTSQIRNIRAGLKSLYENQEMIYHQVESQMSMINVSRKYIAENRKAINQVIIGVHQIDWKLSNISLMFTEDLNTVARFMQIYSQLNLSLQSIKRMIDSATRYLDEIRLETSFLAIGHISPNLILPEEMSNVLFQIKSNLPPMFRLPSHPGRKLWSYFRTLNCAAIIEDDKLIILIVIPLVDANEKYQLYEVHNLAFPDPFQNFGNHETNLMALYRLESDAFMVNTYRTEYILLSREELHSCSQSEGHYCNAHRARLSIAKSKTYLISLFMKNVDNIKRYCIPIIYTNVHLPQAIHLKDGIYAVSTKERFQLRLTCQASRDNSEIQVNPPLTIVKLEMTCSAHNQDITLLPYFTVQTKVQPKNEPFLAMLQESNFSEVEIWQPFIRTFPNFTNTKLPESLKAVDRIPMSDFIDRIRTFQSVSFDNNWHLPLWLKILLGIILLGMIIAIYKARRHIGLILHRLCGKGKEKQEKPEAVVTTQPDSAVQTNPGPTTEGHEDWDVELKTETDNPNHIKSIYPTLDLTTMKSVTKPSGQSGSPTG